MKNIPKLRFPGFNDDWKLIKLKSLGKIVNGLTYSPSDISEDGVLVLRSSNVQDGLLSFEDNVYVKVDNYNAVQENDILICVRNGSRRLIGKNALINKSAEGLAFGAFMSIFRSPSNSFIHQLFNTERYYRTIHINLGATINSINNSELANFSFYFPSEKAEQQKIASFLSSVDQRIELLQKKKSLLEDYKKGVMQKLFSQELRFTKEDGSAFPSWTKIKLKDIGRFYSGGTPKSTKREYYGGDIPFIGSGNISDDNVEQTLTKLGFDNSSAKMVCKGDLLIAMYGATSGEAAISKIDGAINQAVLCVKTDENKKFLLYWLKLKKESIKSKYLQGGQGNLSSKIIKNLMIKLPCAEEQGMISDFLASIDRKIQFVNTQIEKTQQFKKGLMQQMFV